MQNILAITLPFFALIGCGYLAARRKIITDEGIKGLNSFVFYFALPCLIFGSLADRQIGDIFNPLFMGAYTAAGLVTFAIAAIAGRVLFRAPLGVCALQGQAASVSNVGFLGLPLIIALLGEAAALPIVLGWMVDLIILVPLSIAILETTRHDTGALADFVGNVIRGVVLNPFVLSMAVGIFYSATGWPIPVPVDQFTGLLGKAAGPVALFALGATLAGRPMSEGISEAAMMIAGKLFLHPLVMWVTMALVFDFDPLWMMAAVLIAALPIAGNVYIIASSFGLYVVRSSTAILLSTALAVLSFSALVGVLID